MTGGAILKFQFRPLTIDDKITKDGLEAIGTLTGKEPYYVVGGMGEQSYLPTSCRRPTSDIDLSIVKPLNYEDFRALVKPIEECLRDYKYDVEERKHARSFKLDVQNSRNPEERILIEFVRRNKQSFEKSSKRLYRELENAKNKILEERSSTYVVASPEDIAIPKLTRDIHSILRNPDMKKYVPKERIPLSEENVKKNLEEISRMREEVLLAPTDIELAEELRLVSDIYDIRILSEITGFNRNYFLRVCQDWDTVSQKTPERDLIMESILPEYVAELNNGK